MLDPDALPPALVLLLAGVAIGPVVFGLLIPLAGYTGMYLALAATGLVSAGLYWLVHGRDAGSSPSAATHL